MYKSACVYTPTHKHTDLLGAITSYRLNKCAREGWREIEERMNEKEKHILDGQRQKKKKHKNYTIARKVVQCTRKWQRKISILWFDLKKGPQFVDRVNGFKSPPSENQSISWIVSTWCAVPCCALCVELEIFSILCVPLRGITPTQCGSDHQHHSVLLFFLSQLVRSISCIVSSQNSFSLFWTIKQLNNSARFHSVWFTLSHK